MKHIIFSNYNLFNEENEERAKETLEINGIEITEENVQNEIYRDSELDWEDIMIELDNFMYGEHWIVRGRFGGWRGSSEGGKIIHSLDELRAVWEYCDYVEIAEEKGHLYITCSHHDGTNYVELKKVNYKALAFYENWEYNDDKRSEEEIHDVIFNSNFLSALPHFRKNVWGCKD